MWTWVKLPAANSFHPLSQPIRGARSGHKKSSSHSVRFNLLKLKLINMLSVDTMENSGLLRQNEQ